MPNATVLVSSLVEGDVFRFLDKLRDDSEITLARDEVVAFERALEHVAEDEQIAVLLLAGREVDLQPAVAAVRACRPTMNIVAVALETGTATLSLRDPVFEDFHLVIRSLLLARSDQATPQPTGKLLKFTARLPAGALRSAPRPTREEIAPLDADALAVMGVALDWAEAAARALMTVWQREDGEHEPFAFPSLKMLERWLSSWSGIARLNGAQQDFEMLVAWLKSEMGVTTPLGQIAALLMPDMVALKLFLIVLAGDLDMRFNRSFGTLHDDLGRRLPSLGLACAIVAAATENATPISVRAHVATLEWLRALGLIDGVGAEIAALDEPLRIAPPVLEYLTSGELGGLTAHLAAPVLRPFPHDAARLVSSDRRRLIGDAIVAAEESAPTRLATLVSGSAPGWLLADCAALAGDGLLVTPAADASETEIENALRMLIIAERIGGHQLILDLRSGDEAANRLWRLMQPLFDRCASAPLVLTDNPAGLVAQAGDAGHLALAALPPPDRASRRKAIMLAVGFGQSEDAALVDRLAAHILADPAMLAQAAALAGMTAAQAGRSDRPSEGDWLEGLRLAAGPRLPDLATRVTPRRRPPEPGKQWIDTVILPAAQNDQLRAILRHVRFGRTVFEDWGFADLVDGQGVAALLAGESGTGKTMAAHMIASDLGADLYAIDLSQLVSKYIGETEKNLNIAFDEAERAGAVLLFDEADALFGKRSNVSDAHDRYANIEVAYLLQRLQRFPGLALLTSNFPDNVDAAFTRRLRFRVDFPRPAATERLAIWEQSIPAHLRAPGLDLRRPAFALDLTGGMIRMVAVHAAMLAAERGGAIGGAELNAAVRGELIRLGNYDALARLDEILPPTSVAKEAA